MLYYYLISGLPDLRLDSEPRQIDFEETYDTIARNLTEEDRVPYRYLLYANDNRNILLTLFEESQGRRLADFVQPSAFPMEQIRDYRHHQFLFPSYLSQFLEVYADQIGEVPISQMTARLEQLFMEEVENLADDFVSAWLDFDRVLKAIVATYSYSSYDFLSKPPEPADGALLKHLGPGRTIGVALSRAYPYLESLIEVMDTGDPHKLEYEVDQIRWAFLDGFPGFFGCHQVYAYALKLMMIQRTYNLRQEADEGHLASIMDDIKKIESEPQNAIT